jgi:hypothetical protein
MNAVPFDTLKNPQRLEAAGFSGPQASGAAEALAEALVGADLATKGDIASLLTEIKADNAAFRAEVKGDNAAFRAEVKADNAALRADLLSAIEVLRRDMTIRLGGMIIVGAGVLLAGMRFMTLHP